ncbi:hypothetical protein EQG49_05670 [Periweissella cryptocerci]|uniref:Uncharacterized protein n=1 Tax=Periweissella cryptocerci TaxID=2506420 RepID=A0A4P6YTJ0_9LACO|nr:hypothetical protein [Periweissella cryptocerci]QBO35983.1 hypothetical protein EQG49_05670 [Periweissella cryptocerci]
MANKFDDMKRSNQERFDGIDRDIGNLTKINDELNRVADVALNVDSIIDNFDEEFRKQTKMKKADYVFLVTATILQVIRQYALTTGHFDRNNRPDDKTAAGNHDYGDDRGGKLYHPSWAEVHEMPVTFDVNFGSGNFKGASGKSPLSTSGMGHRFSTVGHDPVLGWVFGTANIATRTVTSVDLKSYHVTHGTYGNALGGHDYISKHADTDKVLYYAFIHPFKEKDKSKRVEEFAILVEALHQEWKHLKSDVHTKHSLPVPMLNTVVNSEKFAEEIAKYGLDIGGIQSKAQEGQKTLANVGLDASNILDVSKQAAYAMAINTMIAMLHRMMYDEKKDGSIELYKVRTNKIISYSNIIASSSNVIYVALTKDIDKLDIGGILVTIATVFKNELYREKIFEEFLSSEWSKQVIGDDVVLD